MNDLNKGGQPGAPGQGRRRPKNTYTTKSGKSIKLNQSLGERMKARKGAKAAAKAAYLSTLPKTTSNARWPACTPSGSSSTGLAVKAR